MHKRISTKTQNNQQGLVSIIITLIITIVLTLIVLSFAKISRREQRNALDRQLSTQAFYAAESGINDARKVVQDWVDTDSSKLDTDYMNDCTTFASAPYADLTLPGVLSGSADAAYTCVFVDPSPTQIIYAKSNTQHVFPLQKPGGGILPTMEVYWDNGSNPTDFTGCPAPAPFAHPATWPTTCHAPILRVELVNAANLTVNKVFFLYPSLNNSPAALSFSDTTGSTAQGDCTAGTLNKCKAVIALGGSKYFVRVKSIYGDAALAITVNGGVAQLKGAQAIIDVTGKAQDVIRRIQVRVPANDLSGDVPPYVLEGTDEICKQFSIYGGSGVIDNGSCWTGGNPD